MLEVLRLLGEICTNELLLLELHTEMKGIFFGMLYHIKHGCQRNAEFLGKHGTFGVTTNRTTNCTNCTAQERERDQCQVMTERLN